ncbi:hypothetical protein I4F81_010336 [Pyropia yezoensis]|uniref:Uncharacterized protein n=1 Tax=Pyropia yezoensis TaxID=2788 RepID=A0ACC3CDB7_PYRYE|nr:hypothetical protein I4F81_010336 [Neopyropia yezoensis]
MASHDGCALSPPPPVFFGVHALQRRRRPRDQDGRGSRPASLPMGCSHRGGAVPREVRDGRESGTAHLPGVHALPGEEWSPISLSVVFLFFGWLRMTAARCPPPPLFFFWHSRSPTAAATTRPSWSRRQRMCRRLALARGNWLCGWHWQGQVRHTGSSHPSQHRLCPAQVFNCVPHVRPPRSFLGVRTARSTASLVPGCAPSLLAPSWPLDPSPAAAATPEGATPRPSPSHRRCMYGSGAPARS